MDVDKRKVRTHIVWQCFLLMLFTSLASSVKFGLISPIEVVEEWGCQDSEIRLTCSNLDSTIAILEATFKPNCSMSGRNPTNDNGTDDNNCVQIDLKRLTPVSVSSKTDPMEAETNAGRRFLEALRQHHKKDDTSTDPTVQTVKVASFDFGHKPKDDVNDIKRKRMTLRASLEELLVEYLRGLAPDSNGFDEHSRIKRSSSQNKHQNSDISNENVRKENYVQNKNSVEKLFESNEIDDDRSNRTSNASKSFCPERKQRITQLDRNELNSAIDKISEHEHNIRRLLNYRCSGKNHCSFVFNEDHPFSVLWPYGTVHIKYICMERYRLNKFCGEHLIVVNETPEPEPILPTQQRSLTDDNNFEHGSSRLDEENSVERDGPIAEALIQNEQMFHHLKILKPSPTELENERRKSISQSEKLEKPSPRKVYSQDFRVMKVMPSNLDDFNDIEKIADEFYFKKDEDVENDNTMNRLKTVQTKATTIDTTEPSFQTSHFNPIEQADNTKNFIENTFDSSNNGLRDVRSTLGYDELHNHKHRTSLEPTIQTISTSESVSHQTTGNLWNNELLPPNLNIFETIPIDNGNDIFNTNENQTHGQLKQNVVKTENDFTVINTNRADIDRELESGEEYDASYEDYAVEIDGPKIWRKNKYRAHTSYQKSAIRQPMLQQGFIASPGYPKYYVGNSNCSTKITVPSGQRIRLILLDVDLRYDPVCKDYLQIVDTGSKILLYQNCSELIKPREILSESNELQITIRTKSALAYPKRGILIYYSAHGCILPTAPNNGQLISKTDDSVKFLCDPSYVFPDTIIGSRTLYCTERNTWDNSLPNCVEHATVKTKKEDPYVTQLWKQNRLGVPHAVDEADGIYDILIPLLIMIGLFVVNGFILLVIWRYRKKRKNEENDEQLARL